MLPRCKRTPGSNGMSVALRPVVMRLSEIVIIYLAAAAPFGVAFFLRRQERAEARALALARAVGVALLWPVAAARLLLGRREPEAAADVRAEARAARVERAQRETINALRDAEDAMQRAGLLAGEESRHTLFAARESIERYTGLTLACAEARADAGPTERELELCRLAGRTGRDLNVAGRCIHRRNVTRLAAHRERARRELTHALAAVRELFDESADENGGGREASRAVSRALLQSFARAVELLSLLEDRAAVLDAARLLDLECARLRRLETDAPAHAPKGGETCTTPAAHRAFATPTIPTTTSTRA
jgi:hypothetical protein